ncbi:MAG: carbamoyltransferase HypF [Candidatus Altiarchaeales archaeon]|nr:MAG: carbamoyltransferase HypF [Candidatus Altiarchaeales archaeon]
MLRGSQMLRRAVIHVSGIVQGVGFRPFVYRLAIHHNLKGYVLNLGDAGVEIVLEGEDSAINEFVEDLKSKKPPTARIDSLKITWMQYKGEFNDFKIETSSPRTSQVLSTVPPDVGICDDCIADILTPGRRWYHYPFTCCAVCGPRFTVICDLPYDRERTSMVDFPLCRDCLKEYEDPLDRRYHAEGICCPICGPQMFLYDNKGDLVDDSNPIVTAAKLLSEKYIIAVKGIGGFHIAATAVDDDVVLELRRRRKRKSRPFAVMSPDIPTIRTYAIVSEQEEKLLKSYQRPIVLLRKSPGYYLSKWVSPGLHNVGVMLPYTGIHLLLLHYCHEPALIMTSGNIPGEPMVIDNANAFRSLGNIVDYFLIHNRRIVNRCDDSVLRVTSNLPTFIRRSRGYAPTPIHLDTLKSNVTVLSLGAELQVTGALLREDKCFLTQHIGDVDNYSALNFLKDALSFLLKVTRTKHIDVVVCDLHPNFSTTRLAQLLAEKYNAELIQIQHHFAHLSSLIAESGVSLDDPVVGIVIDGYGYGLDGTAWGGEIILYKDGEFERLGHLRYQPMPGGDASAKYPARMLAGMLSTILPLREVRDFLMSHCLDGFKHGAAELDAVLKQLAKDFNVPRTSSLGRVLDAFSALFGLCYERTYEGEPAMKLESFALSASKSSSININTPLILDKTITINVNDLLRQVINLIESKETIPANIIAREIHRSLAKALAEAAIQVAESVDTHLIGISGGAAVNDLIVSTIENEVRKNGYKLLRHRSVPPGDGGISLGQAFAASLKYQH